MVKFPLLNPAVTVISQYAGIHRKRDREREKANKGERMFC
jgi:hypothetical protein